MMRNLIPHFIQEQYEQEQYEGQFDALTMFVDVSGFTPLTQTLMKQGHEGAEILASILNEVFERMVNAVYERGGFITVFAGDAFTAIFPLQPDSCPETLLALHVVRCAEKIQAIFRRHGIHATPYGQFTLRVKVGVARGEVDWGIVGQKEKAFFFRGEAIDGCAASEHHADKGQIILDDSILALLDPDKIEIHSVGEGYSQLQRLNTTALQGIGLPQYPRRPRLRREVMARFVPESVLNFKEMGEFRTLAPVFISFEGIATQAELDEFASIVLRQVTEYQGYFKEIDFGDKGGVMICFFGAPVAHEKDIDRALNFILSVKQAAADAPSLAALKLRAGITSGRGYAGIIGGAKRCQYTGMGDVVNLAARFMMKAEWGELLVSESIRSKTVQFKFDSKGAYVYKGIAEPVPTYRLLSRKAGIRHQVFQGEMIGRQAELQRLQEFAAPLFTQQFAGIAYIFGEAGVGKSRLSYALLEQLSDQNDVTWFNCPADQILRKAFNPFISFFTRYFEQSAESQEIANKRRFEERHQALLDALAPLPLAKASGVRGELLRTKSVIGAQIGLFWRESLWEQLDAKGKYENTLYAIKNFFLAHSLLKPVIIEIEDGHWIDKDSLAVLELLIRNTADYPIFLLSTLRYHDDGSKTTFELHGINTLEFDLQDLSPEDVKRCAQAQLKGGISEKLHTLLVERTGGNPFYVQQMTLYFVENGIVTLQEGRWRLVAETFKLPDTINAVLIARIDRLAQQVKELVKVASVIGREFDVLLLSAVLKRDIVYQVKVVEENQIWDQLQELQYIFKHALIRDTAYQMQLRARLRELHQLTAEAMETLYADSLAEKYADLAFHYENAEIRDKAIDYLEKAGDQAKARYQNQQALGFYDRLLINLKGVENLEDLEIDTLLKKGEILDLIGEWKTCQQVCEEAFRLSEQIDDKRRMGQAKLALGILFRQTGKYDKAMAHFEQAIDLFDAGNEKLKIGHVHKEMGIVHERKGDYDVAIDRYKRALNICEDRKDTLGMARIATNMGIAYYRKGDYDTAMTWHNKSLHISETLGVKPSMSKVLINVGECQRSQGNYDEAMTYYKQALRLTKELGDKLHIALVLGNIGLVHTAQKDYDKAIECYDGAIPIVRELESKFYLCSCLIDKAEVLFLLRCYVEAEELNTEGILLAEEIEDPEYIFKGKILSAKIAFAIGNKDVPCRLDKMLQETEDDGEIAALHYELWKMTRNKEHRQAAIKLYQTLYETTPNIEYKTRMEEMGGIA